MPVSEGACGTGERERQELLLLHTQMVALQQEYNFVKGECTKLRSDLKKAECHNLEQKELLDSLNSETKSQNQKLREQAHLVDQLSQANESHLQNQEQVVCLSKEVSRLRKENEDILIGMKKNNQTMENLILLNEELQEKFNTFQRKQEREDLLDLKNLQVPLEAADSSSLSLTVPIKQVSSSHALAESYQAGEHNLTDALFTFMTEKDSDLPLTVFDAV